MAQLNMIVPQFTIPQSFTGVAYGSLSMYQASIPVFVRVLGNLSTILDKGAAYAAEKKIEPSVLINARLAADMYPLSRQVQIAADMVKGGAARLAGVEVPSFPDTEVTFPELKERIKKTVAFVQGFKGVADRRQRGKRKIT